MDVRQIITDTATLLQNNAELMDGHQILVDVPEDPVWYVADANQIRQVVWNLSTNGLRAMPNGGALKLSVLGRQPDESSPGEMLIRVEDQGVGIAPEELDGIFQPFRGAFERGTGLGLAIVHRIVSDYGGEVHDIGGIPDFNGAYADALKEVRVDANLGGVVGVTSTPTIVLDNKKLPAGVVDPAALDALIDLELKRSK